VQIPRVMGPSLKITPKLQIACLLTIARFLRPSYPIG
jgi:hypothetical protein